MRLLEQLKTRIEQSGPISVADYMEICVAHYYATRDPFGIEGDFTTAPEISQIFGELIGLWLADQLHVLGEPKAALVELGPGRGTLMADILRATKSVPGFHETVSIHLVETSPILRTKQRALLKGFAVEWHDSIDELPNKPILLIANEFFDALPIRQFAGEKERRIHLPKNKLVFTAKTVTHETCKAAEDIMATLCNKMSQHGGAGLLIDYGYTGGSAGDTLQAVKAHDYVDILDEPGEADLTAHVDFSQLKTIALAAKLEVGLLTQGDFLTSLGARFRAEQLAVKKPDKREAIISGLERLIAVDAMGELFKVLILCSPRPR